MATSERWHLAGVNSAGNLTGKLFAHGGSRAQALYRAYDLPTGVETALAPCLDAHCQDRGLAERNRAAHPRFDFNGKGVRA